MDRDSRDRPAISDAMLEAGASALLDDCNVENLHDGFVTAQEVVEAVFLAMHSAAREPSPSTRPSHRR